MAPLTAAQVKRTDDVVEVPQLIVGERMLLTVTVRTSDAFGHPPEPSTV